MVGFLFPQLVHLLLLRLSDLHGTKPLTSPMFGRELRSISIFAHIDNVLSVWDVRKQLEKEKDTKIHALVLKIK